MVGISFPRRVNIFFFFWPDSDGFHRVQRDRGAGPVVPKEEDQGHPLVHRGPGPVRHLLLRPPTPNADRHQLRSRHRSPVHQKRL